MVIKRFVFSFLFPFFICLFFHNHSFCQAVGYTLVQAAAGENGEAKITVPINCPTGTFVQPSLALTYNSHAGNGLQGLAFNLEGTFQAITRLPSTVAQDGTIDGVDFDNLDRFALNGERLMVITGTYGAGSSEYRTEQNAFTRVVAYGSTGFGPEKFLANSKDGLTFEFGYTADSRIEAAGTSNKVLLWALNRIYDRNGNFLTISYAEDNINGEFRPIQIDYTGNIRTERSPYNRIVFNYENRPDVITKFLASHKSVTTKRLKEIVVYDRNSVFRRYALQYANLPGSSKLVRVTEYGFDNTTPLKPVEFTWVNPSTNSFNKASSGNWNGHGGGAKNNTTGDFDGDSRSDLVGYAGNGSWHVCLSRGGYLQGSYWPGHGGGNENNISGDFNGDGRTDLAGYAGNGKWHVSLSTGTSFNSAFWNGHAGGNTNNISGDFNGDGRTDLAGYAGNGSWHVSLSTGSGFNSTFWSGHGGGVTSNVSGDFNGDGRLDIAGYAGNGKWHVCLSTGTNFVGTYWDGHGGGATNNATGDFNGDGLTDLAGYSGNGKWHVSLSTGTNFISTYWEGQAGGSSNNAIGDFNGDGLTDLAGYAGNGKWHVSLSTGTNFISAFWDGHAGGASNNAIGDFNGDGFTDLAGYTGSPGVWHVALSNAAKSFVASVKNGNGVNYSFNYQPLTQGEVYKKGSSGSYPTIDFTAALYVVGSVTTNNGIGGTKTISYFYEGAKYDYNGRGLRGFEKITQSDPVANMVQTTYFDRNYQNVIARVLKTEIRTNSGQLVKTIEHQIQRTPQHGGKVFFSFYAQVTEKLFEIGQSQPYTSKVTNYVYDNWGNPTSIKESHNFGGSYQVTENNTYANDEAQWLLGKRTQRTVTKTLSGKPSITKNTTYSYDLNGNLTQEVFLPSSATRRVQINYELDYHGNRLSKTISGSNITARSESFSYDTEARNVVSVRNAKGQTIKYTYQNGLTATETDGNNLITRITRDVFGRETRRDFPDGTWKTTAYFNCGAGSGTCPSKSVYYLEEKASGAGMSRTYYDEMDRALREEEETFSTTRSFVDHIYNADGTAKATSKAYYQGGTVQWINYEYDALKRTIKETHPGNRVATYAYNGLTQTAVNFQGQGKTIYENPMGKTVTATDHQGNVLSFDYDSDLNLLSVKDPRGNTITNTYDITGFKTSMTDPDMGTFAYTYNALGLLASQTNPKGEVAKFDYDVLNRPIKRVEPEGTTEWKYDPAYGIGEIHQVVFNNQVVEVSEYNNYNKLSAKIFTQNGASKRFNYTYGAASGLLETVNYPNGLAVKYFYNSRGFLSEIKNASSNALLWKADSYDEDNTLTAFSLGNGLKTIRGYEAATGALKSIETGTNAAPTSVQNLKFYYSPLGNLTARHDNNFGVKENFKYDDLNRLTSTQVINLGNVAQTPVSIAYDVLGNITKKSDVGAYRYGENGAGPHILTSIDHAGVPNCIYPLNQDISYTSYNYVSRVANQGTEVLIGYAPGRNRTSVLVRKAGKVAMDKTIFGGIYEEVKDLNGALTMVCYLKAGDEVFAFVSKTGSQAEKLTYLHTDHLGSVYAHTTQSGQVEQRFSYDAWGKPRNPENWAPLAVIPNLPSFQRGFTFHEMLGIDGLVCMNARVYNPILGRFLSPDPLIQFPEDLQSYNRFAYVMNNPLSMVDPTGHLSLKSIGKFLKENAGAIVSIGITIATGGFGAPTLGWAVLSGAAAGFGGAFTDALINGTSLTTAFKLGLQGGLWGGINGGIAAGLDELMPNQSILNRPFYNEAKVAINGAVQGGLNKAKGGSFEKGFLSSFISGNAKLARDAFVEWRASEERILSGRQIKRGTFNTAKEYKNIDKYGRPFINRNGERVFKSENISVLDMDAYNVGRFTTKDQNSWWKWAEENASFMKFTAQNIPGMNSMAVSHDLFAGWATNNGLGVFDDILNIGTIPIFSVIEYKGLQSTILYTKTKN